MLKAVQNDKAIQEFKEAIKLDPAGAPGHFGLRVASMQSQDYGSPIAPLKKAPELDPGLTAVHKPLGYALMAQGYAAETLKHFEMTKDKMGLGKASCVHNSSGKRQP